MVPDPSFDIFHAVVAPYRDCHQATSASPLVTIATNECGRAAMNKIMEDAILAQPYAVQKRSWTLDRWL
jgi:hypothetical protein